MGDFGKYEFTAHLGLDHHYSPCSGKQISNWLLKLKKPAMS